MCVACVCLCVCVCVCVCVTVCVCVCVCARAAAEVEVSMRRLADAKKVAEEAGARAAKVGGSSMVPDVEWGW